jgi:hypothetical protein
VPFFHLRYCNIDLRCASGHCSCVVNYLIITVIVLLRFNHLLIVTNKLFCVLTYCINFAVECNTKEICCRLTHWLRGKRLHQIINLVTAVLETCDFISDVKFITVTL